MPYDTGCGSWVVTVLGDSGGRGWNVFLGGVVSKVSDTLVGPTGSHLGPWLFRVSEKVEVEMG